MTNLLLALFAASIGVIVLGLGLMVDWRRREGSCEYLTGAFLMVLGLMIIIIGIILGVTGKPYEGYSAVLLTGATVLAIGGNSIIVKHDPKNIHRNACIITGIGGGLFLLFLFLFLLTM